MLPLLLMCQCCGRDLHSATHATILWCCPRMYQHEIKNIWLFFYYIPWGKQFGARVFLTWIALRNVFLSSSRQNVTAVWSFWICRISLFAWKLCLVSVSFSLLVLRFNMVPFVEKMRTEQTVGNKEKISEVLEWFSKNEPLGLNSNKLVFHWIINKRKSTNPECTQSSRSPRRCPIRKEIVTLHSEISRRFMSRINVLFSRPALLCALTQQQPVTAA